MPPSPNLATYVLAPRGVEDYAASVFVFVPKSGCLVYGSCSFAFRSA